MVSAGLWKVRDDYAAELGWDEVAHAVDRAWGSLTPVEQARAAVVAGDYADAGAVRRFGRSVAGHAPPVASGHLTNRYWTPDRSALRATTLVAIGYSRPWLEHTCATVQPAGRTLSRWNVDGDAVGQAVSICRLPVGRRLGDLWPALVTAGHGT